MSNGKELETPATSTPEFIPEAVAAVMALFEGPLKGVSFPGVDSSRLQERIKEVEAAFLALVEVQTRIEGLRGELSSAKDRLLKDAERALAYARVFAGDDAELNDSLSQIEFATPEGERRRKPRKGAAAEMTNGAEASEAAPASDEVKAPKRRSKNEAAAASAS